MPIKLNPASALCVLIDGATAPSTASNYIFRGEYGQHQLQVFTTGTTARNFDVRVSNDGDNWSTIRNQTHIDASATGYTGSMNGVLQLNGCYPWIQVVMSSSTASSDPFTATLYSNNWASS